MKRKNKKYPPLKSLLFKANDKIRPGLWSLKQSDHRKDIAHVRVVNKAELLLGVVVVT